MNSDFYKVYEILYSDYIYENNLRHRQPFPFDEYYIIRTIRRTIDTADKDNKLRPDAKYFLIVNFHHLIVKPLIIGRPYRDFPTYKKFTAVEEDIIADIMTIVSKVKEEAQDSEISGHQIMITIDKLWKKLRTTRLEIWG